MSTVPSAHAWTVSKLEALSFEGDAVALGAYVDAIIDSNYEDDNADPKLLRLHATTELTEFLGERKAVRFVNDLINYLESLANQNDDGNQQSKQDEDIQQQSEQHQQQNNDEDMNNNNNDNNHDDDDDDDDEQHTHSDPSDLNQQQQQQSNHRTLNLAVKRRDHNNDDRLRKPLTDDGVSPTNKEKLKQNENHHYEHSSSRERERNRRPRSPQRLRIERERNHRSPSDILRNRDRDRERERDRENRQRQRQRPSIHSRLGDRNEPRDLRERKQPYNPSVTTAAATTTILDRLSDRERSQKRSRDDDHDYSRREYRRSLDPVKKGRIDDNRNNNNNNSNQKDNNEEDAKQRSKKPDSRVPVPPWPMVFQPPPFAPPIPGMLPGMVPPHLMRGRSNSNGARGSNRTNNRSTQQHLTTTPNVKRLPVLLMSNIPTEKMQLGTIVGFCERFGPVADLRWLHPDRALVLFRDRDGAKKALESVEPIFNNRHVKLVWAKDSDLAAAGSFGGVESFAATAAAAAVATAKEANETSKFNKDKKQYHKNNEKDQDHRVGKTRNFTEQKVQDQAAAEEDLKKKKAEIVARRREQDRRKAQLQLKFGNLLAEQKKLMEKIVNEVNDEEKLKIMAEIRQKQQEATAVQQELRPKPAPKPVQKQQQTPQFPSREALTKDNRPRVVCIRNAMKEVDEIQAFRIFRDTEAVVKIGEEWLIKLVTRRAAESATRAIGPLKRGFGQTATVTIVSVPFPDDKATTAKQVESIIKERGPPKFGGTPFTSTKPNMRKNSYTGSDPFAANVNTNNGNNSNPFGFGSNPQNQQNTTSFNNQGFGFANTTTNNFTSNGFGTKNVFSDNPVQSSKVEEQGNVGIQANVGSVDHSATMSEAEKAGAMVD